MASEPVDPPVYDLGHRGEVDYTLIDKMLALSPTERLRHHEGWRGLLQGGATVPMFHEEMIARLADSRVEFIVVGGVSAVLQGAGITTRDLDICYRRTPENIARLVAALAPLNPRARGFPPDLPFTFDERTVTLGSNFTLDIGPEALDLLGTMSGIGGYEDVISTAVDVVVLGRQVKALALDKLITTKRAAGRKKDLATIPELEETLERKRRQGGQSP
jgi:hypothetical protein